MKNNCSIKPINKNLNKEKREKDKMATLKDIILLKRSNQESVITENLLPENVLHGEVILCYEEGKERLYCKNSEGLIVPIDRIFDGMEITIDEVKPTMETVDLGLPSKKLWAKCNLGANSEEESGLYYAWGETIGYTAEQVGVDKQFSLEDYKWNDGSSVFRPTKYTDSDGKIVLDLEDDAAHITLGGNWRMPTREDLNELTAYTTTQVTSINGIQGMKFISNTNSNYIFFPFSGYAWSGTIHNIETEFYCWSSSIEDMGSSNGLSLCGYQNGNMMIYQDFNREGGLTIRCILSV